MKRIGSIVMALCLCVSLVGCTAASAVSYVIPDVLESVESGVLTVNQNYELEWDDETKCVLLKDRRTQMVWSTTPYAYHTAGKMNYSLSSPVAIEYYDTQDGSLQIARALDCIDMGLVSAERMENGIRVTWYFSEAEITLSTEYVLREDSLQICLPADRIVEGSKALLVNVSVAPYLCSAPNADNTTDYLFVPSGSGALMYTDAEVTDTIREYSGEVYGNDPVRTVLNNTAQEQAVRLPVFGVKVGEQALFAIIESGEGAARINAQAGNPRNGYSAVYATFNVRGYNNIEHGATDTILMAKNRPQSAEFSVGYYPLSGEAADYSGMAACYRRYLEKNGSLQKSDTTQQNYHLIVVGGAQTSTFTLGVPHTTLLSLTSFQQAQTIIGELTAATGQTPEVLLKGFGTSGLDVGKIAGGYAFAEALGSEAEQKALEAYCQENGIPLFTDFDLVQFSQTGGGFSTLLHGALTANAQAAVSHPIKLNVRTEEEEEASIRLLKRSLLTEALDELLSFCGGRVSGIGFFTLSSLAYSDYSEERYELKGEVAAQMRELLSRAKEAGHKVHVAAANGYAAGIADSVSSVPLQNGGYDALDKTVPFYEMVYRGSVPLYTTAMNLSPNSTSQLLRAVEAGVSPSFMLADEVSRETAYLSATSFYGISYESNRSLIKDVVARTSAYFEQIQGARITKHELLQEGVTCTQFENGVCVIVNHTETAVIVNGQKVASYDFYVGGGEEP